jgi:predicted GH43/DUF377 family glycosyl hydrolase
MSRWVKKGLIYCPDGSSTWMQNSVLTPTPFLLNEETIRIYASFRDVSGMGRIGYLDLDARDPARIIQIAQDPVIELGAPGTFDDNGMLLGEIVQHGDKILMYYVGFQLVKQAKFLAFSGLAISSDGGNRFVRHARAPIMDRADEGLYIRAIHTVLIEDGVFHIWYAAGDGWQEIDGVAYPRYHIRYTTSPDGIAFSNHGTVCLTPGPSEYRIGRPRVRKIADGYEMRFTFDTLDKRYTSGRAFSKDKTHWTRAPDQDLPLSPSGWDSKEACYPCVLDTKYGRYIFYDGNGMGRDGFGYAEWVA